MKVINIVPKPAPRPRFSKYGTYNAQTYTNYKRALQLQMKGDMKSSATKLEVVFYMPIPKSTSKKKTLELDGAYHIKKPDSDNLIKALLDAMNKTLITDDNVICKIDATKRYSTNPRIEYKLVELND